ncbi:hypothetical protein A2U01_0013073, partial [Trifolium medium]|nr:hypothetical protein [Trifolium medium]
GKVFFFTAVYASPHEEGRHELWMELKSISHNMMGEWLLAGDFNDIMHPLGKKGGAPATQRRCDKFMDRINDCSLLDCGAIGPKYTWRGPVFHGHDRIFERLDRALSNDNWRIGFLNAVVKVLPRVNFSDHHPLLIDLFGSSISHRLQTFKFESAWLLEDSYVAMLESCWDGTSPIYEQLINLSHVIKEWKNISIEKPEAKIQKELAHILKAEELMWFQRSRARWLVDGDWNTRYYHLKTITRTRRQQNRISMLRDSNGGWVEEADVLKQKANNFYKALFSN